MEPVWDRKPPVSKKKDLSKALLPFLFRIMKNPNLTRSTNTIVDRDFESYFGSVAPSEKWISSDCQETNWLYVLTLILLHYFK